MEASEASLHHGLVPRSKRPGEEAVPTVQLAFRLPVELVKQIDEEARRIAPPGISVTRTDVVRVLLREALVARSKQRQKK